MNRRHVVVEKWCSDFYFHKDILGNLPVWIRLPKLDLHFWGEDSLSKMVSLMSSPIYVDESTSE